MAPIPEPVSPLENLIRLALMMFLGIVAFFGADWSSSMNPPRDGDANSAQPSGSEVLTVIERVEPIILESYPYQIQLRVTGYQPDGCTFPVQVEQARDDSTVTVKIFRVLPPDILCTMQLVPYDETISLEGGFESGTYTIDVNGTIVELTL